MDKVKDYCLSFGNFLTEFFLASTHLKYGASTYFARYQSTVRRNPSSKSTFTL